MKTGIFTPCFYLASKGFSIKINSKTVIGRNQGTIILEDDELLSSTHCEITPTLLDVTIRDLDSTNGVFVNKQKIFPNSDVKLKIGDEVKIGSRTYLFLDDEKEVKKIDPPMDRRRHPRAKNLYSPENLINFYSAPIIFRVIYLGVFVAVMASTFINMHLEIPVPENISFLSKFYTEQIIFSGVKVIFLAWGISITHALLLHLYFNRNPWRKLVSLGCYIALILLLVDFKQGPLGGLKGYLTTRQSLENLSLDQRGIVQLKTLVQYQENLARGHSFTRRKLSEDDQIILDKDFKNIEKKLIQRISKINKAKSK